MSRTILLVEDNEQNRYLATFLLEQHGYRVESASDGPRAIEMAQARTPDLVLLDIQLPTMDGYEVARRLRALPALRATPIIAVTSYAMVGDRDLQERADRMVALMKQDDIFRDVATDSQIRGLQAQLSIHRHKANPLGVQIQDIRTALYTTFGEREVPTTRTPTES